MCIVSSLGKGKITKERSKEISAEAKEITSGLLAGIPNSRNLDGAPSFFKCLSFEYSVPKLVIGSTPWCVAIPSLQKHVLL